MSDPDQSLGDEKNLADKMSVPKEERFLGIEPTLGEQSSQGVIDTTIYVKQPLENRLHFLKEGALYAA